jgi:hypothetical protein
MNSKEDKKIRPMPKGGRTGGTSFPRVTLKDALGYAKKLVTKTHSVPQPQDVIFSGVVGAKSGTGNVRIAALKQYGLIKGDAKTHYAAEILAKQIQAAPPEELLALYQKAMLRPPVFKKIFDAFHGDTVTKAKLKQRVADLHVHPDQTEACVDLYLAGMMTAGLVSVDGDKVTHLFPMTGSGNQVQEAEHSEDAASAAAEGSTYVEGNSESGGTADMKTSQDSTAKVALTKGPRAVFNVNITLDASLDVEKLAKQLDLLRRFGAI